MQRNPLPDDNISYTNTHGPRTEYLKGAIIKADRFDLNRWNECSNGIHGFITRIEAENYQ